MADLWRNGQAGEWHQGGGVAVLEAPPVEVERAATTPVADCVTLVELGQTTADALIHLPARNVGLVDEFRSDQLRLLQELLAEAYSRVAQEARERIDRDARADEPVLMVPVVYVLGRYEELGPAVVGRVAAAGATFVELDEWPTVLEDLLRVEAFGAWPSRD